MITESIDTEYDLMHRQPHLVWQYYWPKRCYKWVVEIELQPVRGTPAPLADILEPERLPPNPPSGKQTIREQIIELLTDCGPLTVIEIVRHTGMKENSVRTACILCKEFVHVGSVPIPRGGRPHVIWGLRGIDDVCREVSEYR